MSDIPNARDIEKVVRKFEVAWQQGAHPVIEQYLYGWSGTGREELLIQLIFTEVELRQKDRQSPRQADYMQRFPELADQTAIKSIFVHETTFQKEPIPATTVDFVSSRPKTIGRFEILDVLGKGGCGLVYMARDPKLGRKVAIKVPTGKSVNVDLYRREAQALARLDHPNIVAIYEVGEDKEKGFPCYIVSQYIEGYNLDERLNDSRVLREDDTVKWNAEPTEWMRSATAWIADIADALVHAHQKGIYHLDVKPANILIDDERNSKLADFGLARADNRLIKWLPGGTLAYMSPEQLFKCSELLKIVFDIELRVDCDRQRELNVTPGIQSDIFSLGLVLYELLTGRHPFSECISSKQDDRTVKRQKDHELVHRLASKDAIDTPRRYNENVPVALENVCKRALAKNPSDRYPVAQDLAHDIRVWLTESRSSAPSRKPINLPFATLGSLFKGRDKLLEELRQGFAKLNPDGSSNIAKAHVLHGLGGVGKTRAAIEYAWRHLDDYQALLFLNADSPTNLEGNLASLTSVLEIEGMNEATDDVRLDAVLRWLSAHLGWLMILDNVDDQESAAAVKERLGQFSQGHVLITSRLSQWSAAVEKLELDVLTCDAAADYLLEATAKDRRLVDNDETIAQAIAVELGQLALALEHSAAYINNLGLTLVEYLEEWKRNFDAILQEFDLNQIDYPREILVTWKMTADRLSEDARTLLDLLCWFAPDPIPEDLLSLDLPISHSRRALAELVRFSLARREKDSHSFTIHRLVQATTRIHLTQRPEKNAANSLNTALKLIDTTFIGNPEDVRDWPRLDPLADHVTAICNHATLANLVGQKHPTSLLLNRVGLLYYKKAQYASAEPLMRRALAIDELSFGAEHPDVARDLISLSALLQYTNRLAEAEPLLRRALANWEQSYGPQNPHVAGCLNNLAQLLQATNRLAEAEPLMRRALGIFEQSYGAKHPHVATNLNNLALLLQATNRLAEAEPLMRRALAIFEQSYGAKHPHVAVNLNNLALLLQATNRLSEAEPLCRRALAIDEQSYGNDHPKVATDLDNLAGLLYALGRHDEAILRYQRVVEIFENSYGKNHPNVAVVLNNLAQLFRDTNDLAEAEPLIRRALAIFEQSYGAKHPNVARDLNNLAMLLKDTNRLAEAEPLMRRALAIDEQSCGTEHPNVAIKLNNLAMLLQTTNRLAEAEPLMRRHVEIFINFGRVTGHQHPHMQEALRNYRNLLGALKLSDNEITNRMRPLNPVE